MWGSGRRPVNLDEVRARARRRLPKMVFDFVDGGSEDEISVRRNREAFADLVLQPRDLADVSTRSQATTVLGEALETPVLLAPTGAARLVHRDGEVGAGRAAARAGTRMVLGAMSSDSVEQVAAASGGRLWFQIYSCRDRWVTEALLDRAERAGVTVLCITIDAPVVGRRERDLRNGMALPPQMRPSWLLDVVRRPRWAMDLLRRPEISFGSFEDLRDDVPRGGLALGRFAMDQVADPGRTWDEVRWLRERWPGPVVVKGVMSAAVARRAVDIGAEAVVVSNHGGRQLDGLGASVSVVPEVVDALGGRAQVLVDGGVRRGTDVIKAIALGADACLIGRPWLHGLAMGGEGGVGLVLDQLRDEIDRALALLGCRSLAEVDRRVLAGRGTVRGG